MSEINGSYVVYLKENWRCLAFVLFDIIIMKILLIKNAKDWFIDQRVFARFMRMSTDVCEKIFRAHVPHADCKHQAQWQSHLSIARWVSPVSQTCRSPSFVSLEISIRKSSLFEWVALNTHESEKLIYVSRRGNVLRYGNRIETAVSRYRCIDVEGHS